jgi:NitT/TauT family transport system permease protein
MSMYSLSDAASVGADRPARQALAGWVQNSGPGVAAGIAWIAFGLACLVWNDVSDWSRTLSLGIGAFVVAAFILLGTLSAEHLSGAGRALRLRAPWLAVLGVLFTLWELATAKFAWLPLPFFPPPQAIIEVYTDDLPKLLDSVFASVKLQLGGYVIGATLGFVTGVSIGWSRSVGYWVHPLLRFIGPLPATAWLPIAFFTFPSSWSASTFLIALATGFPVTVLTWSGVASVSNSYYDVARTLGAKPSFLVLKVAIPAALPHVFVGLFMGLGSSFAVLVVAEMIGVKAGLGWYLQWAQGWAAYANMYAALIVMSLLCSGAITLLFRARDRLLVWQKGVVKW